MNNLTLYNEDNLKVLHQLKASGQKFDLVEIDGPYMAGLEDWDNMTEQEYIQHYAERLTLVRDVLKPWGVVFVFGYPEGISEIKVWCRQSKILGFLRWITWYKQWTLHSARKTEHILCLCNTRDWYFPEESTLLSKFRMAVKQGRERLQMNIKQAYLACGGDPKFAHKAGGWFWYENKNSRIPTAAEYMRLKEFFGLPSELNDIVYLPTSERSFKGLTDIDYVTVPTGNSVALNDKTLRSKSPELYLKLFQPVPTNGTKKALVLYGGSGNAGIAAACLDYNVVMCETSEKRCEAIRQCWEKDVKIWRERTTAQLELMATDNKKMVRTSNSPRQVGLFN